MSNQLSSYRKEIDKINNNILNLIARRLRISKKIGDFKKKMGLKIFDKKREKQIFDKLKKDAKKKKLDPNYVLKIFQGIISYSREVQK